MNIGSGNGYPQSALSNFTPNTFIFDGVLCNSMEGLLQGFKFKSIEMQAEVCKMVGKKAKFKGKPKKWYKDQLLYWKGLGIRRDSKAYQILLDKAYMAMYEQCPKFRKALEATNKSVLKHSMGKNKINETVLTESEFCSRLTKLRDNNGIL